MFYDDETLSVRVTALDLQICNLVFAVPYVLHETVNILFSSFVVNHEFIQIII